MQSTQILKTDRRQTVRIYITNMYVNPQGTTVRFDSGFIGCLEMDGHCADGCGGCFIERDRNSESEPQQRWLAFCLGFDRFCLTTDSIRSTLFIDNRDPTPQCQSHVI
eukprot:382131_1